MRKIDADKIKEKLEKLKNDYEYASDNYTMIEYIEELIICAPTLNEWTPVSKAMPPEHEEVYDTERGETVMESDLVTVTALDNNGERYTGYGYTLDGEFGFGDPILAWMPMPEPYEGDENDTK